MVLGKEDVTDSWNIVHPTKLLSLSLSRALPTNLIILPLSSSSRVAYLLQLSFLCYAKCVSQFSSTIKILTTFFSLTLFSNPSTIQVRCFFCHHKVLHRKRRTHKTYSFTILISSLYGGLVLVDQESSKKIIIIL